MNPILSNKIVHNMNLFSLYGVLKILKYLRKYFIPLKVIFFISFENWPFIIFTLWGLGEGCIQKGRWVRAKKIGAKIYCLFWKEWATKIIWFFIEKKNLSNSWYFSLFLTLPGPKFAFLTAPDPAVTANSDPATQRCSKPCYWRTMG